MKQSNGHINIYSEPGQGTTIKVYLPRLQHEGEAAPDLVQPDGPFYASEAHETVLVVEDEEGVRRLVTDTLNELGYGVLEASDGQSGYQLVERHPEIALLLTDVGLPGMNGRQLAEAARRLRPNLKILYMTGYARNAIVRRGQLDAGVEVITKPFAAAALAQKVRSVIEGE